MQVPFVDLKAQYLSIKNEIDAAIAEVLQNTSFIGGEPVRQFEAAFAEYTGTRYCVSCANGTDALEILLRAMGIGADDEVIVPAISWIATSEAVSLTGATPIFVDVEPDFYTIDPARIEEKITSKTKAIIPVHLYGQPANMSAILEISQKHRLKVLEDCAQAHGAKLQEKIVGTWGDCASFSFFPGKNLGAYGDAGAMITNSKDLAEKARRIANHGQLAKHDHEIEGRNSRLDALQAAILKVKLKHLKKWTQVRIQHATAYTTLLADVPLQKPTVRKSAQHVYHLYVVRSKRRDELKKYLKQNGIDTKIHYPEALPFLPCYQNYGHGANDFPKAAQYPKEALSLPIYAELSSTQITRITKSIQTFFSI